MIFPTPLALVIIFISIIALAPLLGSFAYTTLANRPLRPSRLRDRIAEARDNLAFTVRQKAYASARLVKLLGAWMVALGLSVFVGCFVGIGVMASPLAVLVRTAYYALAVGVKVSVEAIEGAAVGALDAAQASLPRR